MSEILNDRWSDFATVGGTASEVDWAGLQIERELALNAMVQTGEHLLLLLKHPDGAT